MSFVDESGESLGVAAVVLGAGGADGFTVAFDEGGVDEVDGEGFELTEEVDEVLAGLFDAEGDGLVVGEVGAEAFDPGGRSSGAAEIFCCASTSPEESMWQTSMV